MPPLHAKALAHPYRLELLEQLSQGERNVEVLADRIQTSLSNTSQHLLAMRRAGLVDSRREGNLRFYYLADEGVLGLLAWLRSIAERNSAEFERVVRGYFQLRDNQEPVTRMDLLERLNAGPVTVLDLRPEDEFALGHLPGAVNTQLSELMGGLRNSILNEKSLPTPAGLIARWRTRQLRCSEGVASESAV